MKNKSDKNLFIEISEDFLILTAGSYDEELNFKIIDHVIKKTTGIKAGKIIDLDQSKSDLKDCLNNFEKKLDHEFENANIITGQNDIECINISGYKKLNGNQILSDDIYYILNDLKKKIVETEKEKSIIHLFNTEFTLDKNKIENLPIGLRGNFYCHQLSFFLLSKKTISNFQELLNSCNLNLNKTILKSFVEGIYHINKKRGDTFISIEIGKKNSKLIFFNNSAFCFFQNFEFGTDMILKDISKICSLSLESINKFFLSQNLRNKKKNDDDFLDRKYFENKNFRKISINHIMEISDARIEELTNIFLNKNLNLDQIRARSYPIFIKINDEKIFLNLSKSFEKFTKYSQVEIINDKVDSTESALISGELVSKGWSKEAISIIQKKTSFISRIFSKFFE